MKSVRSHNELINEISKKPRSLLLLYKQGSELSSCALKNLSNITVKNGEEIGMLAADVSTVRDIHQVYGITTVPALLIFERDQFINVIKGCHESAYYKALAENAIFHSLSKASGRTQKSVKVYSTPSCSWCNTLKVYLRKQGIAFTDIDISRDEQAAQELVRRSGQSGVPQTEIEGQIIVGFDRTKINNALGING
ncbi:MAG: hypothetical protein JXB19_07545 [Bacteroidales bacterium]|nr:hypothetical protein [Bacteroidales bacterium]